MRLLRKIMIMVLFSCAMSTMLCAANDEPVADEKPFSRFIKPMTNPVYFDDARNETYIHVIHVYQNLPHYISTTLGRLPLDGQLNLTALRVNVALNERFSLLAAKDGYIDFDPDETLKDESGAADIAAGLKYAFLYYPEQEFILSGKVLFELTHGTNEVFQGNGDGNAAPSFTFLKGFDKFQFEGTLGWILPFNHNEESTMFYNSWHVSYAVTPHIFPLLELNHFRVIRGAHRDALVPSIVRFEGGDVINLGSEHGLDHRDFVSMAAGLRYRVFKNLDLGFAFEWPLTDENIGLMQNRYSFDLILHF